MNKNALSWYLLLKKFWLPCLCLLLLLAAIPQFSAAAPLPVVDPKNRPAGDLEPDPAQGPPPGAVLWRDINETALRDLPDRQIIPTAYRLVEVDLPALDQLLGQAPLADSLTVQSTSVELTLPLPDGRFGRFLVVEAPLMAPDLATQYPEIKTYRGWGLDDPTATVRLDRTPAGFHGLILSAGDTVYLDPYRRGDILRYLSYYKGDYNNIWGKTRQETPPLPGPQKPAGAQEITPSAVSANIRRTYRLAVAATGEYTAFHGGTKAAAQAAIVTTVNRVAGIYEREFLVSFTLINNTNIIYTNPATDPYTNNSGFTMLSQNQSNLNSVIGSANYDIGHVFSTGGGGVAGLGVVCSSFKAQGVTGSSNPVGDPFDVDYVAHEMGHQFGASHTFNAVTGSCSGNRVGSRAYEPGSGSTIMAYAGICSPQNLQPNSDDYFHGTSFDEIMAYITDPFGGDSCGSKTTLSNAAPVVSAGSDFTIPQGTPFTLTGSASDANGDALTYGWEEFDLGSSDLGGLPNTDTDAARPIFRSYKPVSGGARTFPALSSILDGSNSNSGESLPTRSRTMQFRLTARDNKGGVANDSMAVTVDGNSGPFAVTAPNTAVPWIGSNNETITWDVANTTASPVSCAAVNIRLSTDGGTTFSKALVLNTPNDGSEIITVPNNSGTTTARVKVECANNIFFDISNANFTISGANVAIAKTVTVNGTAVQYTIVLTNSGPATASNVRVTDTLPGGITGSDLDTTTDLSSGQSVNFTVNATLDENLPDNTQITNTAAFNYSDGTGQSSATIKVGDSTLYLPVISKDN